MKFGLNWGHIGMIVVFLIGVGIARITGDVMVLYGVMFPVMLMAFLSILIKDKKTNKR